MNARSRKAPDEGLSSGREIGFKGAGFLAKE